MKNKKGFTLVELIAVIVILAIISLIAIPSVISTLNYSKKTIHDEQLAELEKSARNWYVQNIREIEKERDYCVSVAELIQTGYIDRTEVVDSATGENLDGYVLITYQASQETYEFEYAKTCDIDMSGFRLRLMNTMFNSLNWSKSTVKVAVIGGNDTVGYRYCKSTTAECEPNVDVSSKNGTIEMDAQGETNYVCAYGKQKDGTTTDKKCMGPYKIDTTPPELTINGNLTFKSSESNLNLLQGLTVTDNMSSRDKITITTSGVVSEGIVGEYIVNYLVADQAGNTTSQTRKVIIVLDDKDEPGITLTVSGKPFNSNNWAKSNITVIATADDGAGSGISSYTFCTTQNSSCTPTTKVNASSGRITVDTESTTNHVCAYATDKTGNTSSTVCVGPYKLDKTAPVLNVPADSTISVTTTGTNLNTGVSYSDNLTAQGNLVYTKEGSLSEGILGTYPIKYTVMDEAGNTTVKVRNITVGDVQAPHLAISSSGSFNSNGWANKNFSVNFSSNDGDGIGVKSITYCSNSSAKCTPNTAIASSTGAVTVSAESATNYVCAYAEDIAGNKSETQCVGPYKLDKTAPVITVNPAEESITDKTTSYTADKGWSYSDNLSSNTYLAGTKAVTGNITLGQAGLYSIEFSVTDEAGNRGSGVRSLAITDTTAPELTISTTCSNVGENGWCKGSYTTTINGSDAASQVAKIEYKIGDGSWTEIDSTTHTVNTAGSTTVYYRVTDLYGNVSTTKQYVSNIDTQAPNAPSNSVSGSSVTVNHNGDNGSSGICAYKLDSGSWQSSNSFSGLGFGTHTTYVKDCAGNESSGTSFTISASASVNNTSSGGVWSSSGSSTVWKTWGSVSISSASVTGTSGSTVNVRIVGNVATGYGWLHNSDNYWRNVCLTQHHSTSTSSGNCKSNGVQIKAGRNNNWNEHSNYGFDVTVSISNPSGCYDVQMYGPYSNDHLTATVTNAICIG